MDIKTWFKNLIATNYFFTRVQNTKEISDPIVSAIEKKVIPTVDTDAISSPIVNALEDVITAIEDKEGIEEVTVKNISEAKADFTEVITILTNILNKEEKEIEFPEQKDVVIDLKPVVKGLEELKKKIPVIKPLKLVDYTDSLKRIVSAIEVDRTENLPKIKDIDAIATLLQQIRDKEEKEIPFEFKDGRLKVEVDRAGGGSFSDPGVKNIANEYINPATEETLKEVRDALGGGTSTWYYVQKETGATYKYYGYASSTGWKIMRKTLATGVFGYAQDTAEAYETGWANRTTHTYTNAL
jgi:hypothetical protein